MDQKGGLGQVGDDARNWGGRVRPIRSKLLVVRDVDFRLAPRTVPCPSIGRQSFPRTGEPHLAVKLALGAGAGAGAGTGAGSGANVGASAAVGPPPDRRPYM